MNIVIDGTSYEQDINGQPLVSIGTELYLVGMTERDYVTVPVFLNAGHAVTVTKANLTLTGDGIEATYVVDGDDMRGAKVRTMGEKLFLTRDAAKEAFPALTKPLSERADYIRSLSDDGSGLEPEEQGEDFTERDPEGGEEEGDAHDPNRAD